MLANLGSNLNYKGTGARGRRAARHRSRVRIDVPTLPQQANLLDQGLPAPDHVPGRPGLRLLSPGEQPSHRARRLQPAEQQQARIRLRQRVEPQQARRLELRLRPPRELQLLPAAINVDLTSASTTGLNDEENLQGLAFGGGVQVRLGSERVLAWAWTTRTSTWASSARPTSSASRSGGKMDAGRA